MVLRQPNNQYEGGEEASREFAKCRSKNNENKGNSEKSQFYRRPFSWRKHLSLETVYFLQGISEILKSRLRIRTTGDISARGRVQCDQP
jgi:hypothetical protein